ncbi:MAG: hypothetical protein AAGF11_32725 [Myxococcota bacterium]
MRRAIAILVLALVAPSLFFAVTLDDAFITFRFASHFAEGLGYGVWNPTEAPVEGFTTPLFMLLLSGASSLGLEPATAAKLIGWASHLGATALVVAAALAHERDDNATAFDRSSAWVAALLHATLLPAVWYSTSGMETSLVALLVTWAMWHPVLMRGTASFVVPIVALTLVRPEGFAFGLVIAAMHAWRRRDDARARLPYLVGLLAALATMAALLTARTTIFGPWLPNTYYAKGTGPLGRNVLLGLGYNLQFGAALLPILLPAWLMAPRGRKEPVHYGVEKIAYGLVLLVAASMIKVGGDSLAAFPFFRQFVHILPAIAYVAARGVCRSVSTDRRSLAIAAAISALIAVSAAQWHKERVVSDLRTSVRSAVQHGPLTSPRPTAFHQWLRTITFDHTVTAVLAAGAWPYHVDRGTFIDMLGLCDAHIAHHGHFDSFARVDSKTDIDYVMSREPDILDGYLPARPILQGLSREQVVSARAQMINALLDHPQFRQHYELVVDAPYEVWRPAVFIRREYLQTLPPEVRPRTIDVRETSLYRE